MCGWSLPLTINILIIDRDQPQRVQQIPQTVSREEAEDTKGRSMRASSNNMTVTAAWELCSTRALISNKLEGASGCSAGTRTRGREMRTVQIKRRVDGYDATQTYE